MRRAIYDDLQWLRPDHARAKFSLAGDDVHLVFPAADPGIEASKGSAARSVAASDAPAAVAATPLAAVGQTDALASTNVNTPVAASHEVAVPTTQPTAIAHEILGAPVFAETLFAESVAPLLFAGAMLDVSQCRSGGGPALVMIGVAEFAPLAPPAVIG